MIGLGSDEDDDVKLVGLGWSLTTISQGCCIVKSLKLFMYLLVVVDIVFVFV